MYIFQKLLDGKDIQDFFGILLNSHADVTVGLDGLLVIDLLSLISVGGSCGVFVNCGTPLVEG